eukprot:jgi/Mesen1/6235/ME000321S05303
MPVDVFRRKLQNQLPAEVRVLDAHEVPVKYLNGRLSETINQLLYAAEYVVAAEVLPIETEEEAKVGAGPGPEGEGAQVQQQQQQQPPLAVSERQWREWAAQIMNMPSFEISRAAKAGDKRDKVVDLRKQLLELSIYAGDAPLPAVMQASWQPPEGAQNVVVLRFAGVHDPAAGTLRPESVLHMLASVSGYELELLHAHRCQFRLHTPQAPRPNMQFLKGAVQHDAFMALLRRWDGSSLAQGTQVVPKFERPPAEPVVKKPKKKESWRGNRYGCKKKASAAAS